MTQLSIAHAAELLLVAAGALVHVHTATARNRNARALWYNGLLFAWTLCWSTWYALSFITLNLETLDIGRVPMLSMCLDEVKGALINVQAGLLLHGIARWTRLRAIPAFVWYLLPAAFIATGFGPLLASPMSSFLRNVDDLVLAFLLCDALQSGAGAWLLRKGRLHLGPAGDTIAAPLRQALAWSVPLLVLSAGAKWAQGGYRAGRYDWVLLFDLAHLLPPAALLVAAHRSGTVALDVTRASLLRLWVFVLPFAAYMAHKLLLPGSALDRILTVIVAGAGFLLLLGPLASIAVANLGRALNLGLQRESRALAALDERLRGRDLPPDPALFAARCIGRILSCRTTVLPPGDQPSARIRRAAGAGRLALLGQARAREEILAWEELGARILLPLRPEEDEGEGRSIVLGPSRKAGRLPSEILARLSAVLASLQASLDARTELHARLEAERRLQEGERLAMLGLLSASAAHEIRNPLSAIRNIAHAAQHETPEGSTIRADLAMIASEVDRLDATVRRMLHFARDRGSCENAVATLEATCGLLDQESRARGVRLATALPSTPVPMPMSENDLKATVFNLVLNALQHSPSGSVVDVRLLPDGPSLEVENDGEIPDEFRPRLFRPLATRGGTGLGLYICRKRAEESGGRLVHEPLPGRTLFRLTWSHP